MKRLLARLVAAATYEHGVQKVGARATHVCVALGVSGAILAGCSGEDSSTAEQSLSPEIYAAYLEQISNMYEVADPPSVDIVRVVNPDEQLDLIAGCMQEEGWPATAVKDGGLQYQNIPEQKSAINESFYACFAQYPLAEEFLAVGPDHYEELYDYFVNEVKPCLEGQGIAISDPPSFESWLAVAEQDEGKHWDPTVEIPDSADFQALQEICPQNPP
ncbi:hypothetical protein [Ornithinimicrobium murale]|uniref:hypothetical protein n=1 Tax=Ornithinimicrobium murale TaxID=1050153 RepID=UPI0013B38DB5|nr:hypothetical protein [Ornithinimicrobium murale]